ncbi:hypothetical protein BH10CYA1_BH10CYA1_44870 [soil metagenome]
MKMTDSIGRTLSVDLVHRTESLAEPGTKLWTRPLEYNLEHSGVTYCAVPHGAFGLRVMSRLGAELLVYQDGKLLIAAKIEKGVQYLERDAEGNLLMFRDPTDAVAVNVPAESAASEGISLLELPAADATEAGDESEPSTLEAKQIPNVPGLIFVVARLAKDLEIIGHQPPDIEYELEIQLNTVTDHMRNLAGSLSKMVVPALPPDCNDLVSLTPSERPVTTFVCSCTGCKSQR